MGTTQCPSLRKGMVHDIDAGRRVESDKVEVRDNRVYSGFMIAEKPFNQTVGKTMRDTVRKGLPTPLTGDEMGKRFDNLIH